MVDIVNKAPNPHWWHYFIPALKLKNSFHYLIIVMSMIVLTLAVLYLCVALIQYKKDNKEQKQILIKDLVKQIPVFFLIEAMILIGGITINISAIKPTPFSFSDVNSNPYLLKSDTKAINRIKRSKSTLYYDKQNHVLNEFPEKVSNEEKNKAALNNNKIKKVTLYGSKQKALDGLIDSNLRYDMSRILAVSNHNNKTTIFYTN